MDHYEECVDSIRSYLAYWEREFESRYGFGARFRCEVIGFDSEYYDTACELLN
jgi:hypothetical protein